MNTNYITPSIEVIDIEIEDAVLAVSGGSSVDDFNYSGSIGDW